jgi:hypothetical protein
MNSTIEAPPLASRRLSVDAWQCRYSLATYIGHRLLFALLLLPIPSDMPPALGLLPHYDSCRTDRMPLVSSIEHIDSRL